MSRDRTDGLRWNLTEQETDRIRQERARPLLATTVALLALRRPRLLPTLVRSMLAGAVEGVRGNSGLVWTLEAERARLTVPDAATGAWNWGAESFLDVLRPHLGKTTVALEVACGGGRVARLVAPLVRELVCSDVAPLLLEESRRNLAPFENVQFFRNRGYTLEGLADDRFDVVYMHDFVLQIDPLPLLSILDESRRVLKPGGVCLASFFTIERPEWARRALEIARDRAAHGRYGPSRERPYVEAQIHALYETAGLEVVEARYGDPEPDAAQPHYYVVGRARAQAEPEAAE